MAGVSRKISTMVTTRWLAETLSNKQPKIRLLDGSWHMPFTKRNPQEEFFQRHIPEAQFFAIDGCCDKSTTLDHMLPTPGVFEDYVGSKLGINNNTHVVVYDNNETFGMLSAQRVWWTFRVFGHDSVSILDGGLPKWLRDGYDFTDQVASVEPQVFKANFRPELVRGFEDVEENMQSKNFTVVDARPKGRFDGVAPEPREGIESGHMPRAKNVPFTSFIDAETKTLKSPEEIQKVFDEHAVDLSKPIVGSCGSGISACLVALGAHMCGQDEVAVYDGSWTEWYLRANPELVITSKKDSPPK